MAPSVLRNGLVKAQTWLPPTATGGSKTANRNLSGMAHLERFCLKEQTIMSPSKSPGQKLVGHKLVGEGKVGHLAQGPLLL